MKALVTGASSGIGKEIASYLSHLGYDLILVSRDVSKLEEVQKQIATKSEIKIVDLSNAENCKKLYEEVKEEQIDILVNNAGFGLFGDFTQTSLDTELHMIDTNITAVHILTKLFLQDMKTRNSGYILNVASIAGYMAGPLMATYYATKAYVLRLTQAIHKELKKDNSNVHVSVLCPGPVDTNFNSVAGVRFKVKSQTSQYVARYAIEKLLKKKLVIIPDWKIKLAKIASRLSPEKLVAECAYYVQRRKRERTK